MSGHLLDTDVMIDVSRGNVGAASFVDSLGDSAISIITAHELIVGARDKRDLAGIDALISTYAVAHLNAAIGLLAYDLLKKHSMSDGLRTFDALIAATAMQQGLILASRNRKHFVMIDGLQIVVPQF